MPILIWIFGYGKFYLIKFSVQLHHCLTIVDVSDTNLIYFDNQFSAAFFEWDWAFDIGL